MSNPAESVLDELDSDRFRYSLSEENVPVSSLGSLAVFERVDLDVNLADTSVGRNIQIWSWDQRGRLYFDLRRSEILVDGFLSVGKISPRQFVLTEPNPKLFDPPLQLAVGLLDQIHLGIGLRSKPTSTIEILSEQKVVNRILVHPKDAKPLVLIASVGYVVQIVIHFRDESREFGLNPLKEASKRSLDLDLKSLLRGIEGYRVLKVLFSVER